MEDDPDLSTSIPLVIFKAHVLSVCIPLLGVAAGVRSIDRNMEYSLNTPIKIKVTQSNAPEIDLDNMDVEYNLKQFIRSDVSVLYVDRVKVISDGSNQSGELRNNIFLFTLFIVSTLFIVCNR